MSGEPVLLAAGSAPLVTAAGHTSRVAGDSADEILEIATPAALLATKAHALEDRHEPRKRASDTTDIIGLLDTSEDQIAATARRLCDELD